MLIPSFPWARYSKKLVERIVFPKYVGRFTEEEAKARQMRLATGKEGELSDGNVVIFFWLVDPEDGIIVDAAFQVFGPSALIGAADVVCELCMRKNYDQAKRIGAELIDRTVRDKSDIPAFPEETSAHLNLVLAAIESAADQCCDIPFAEVYTSPPTLSEEQQEYPNWNTLSVKQQLSVLEQIIASEIRPYIELDAGGVEVLDVIDHREVIISYRGSCTTCHSATGGTLNAIQQILRTKIHPELIVIPDMNSIFLSRDDLL